MLYWILVIFLSVLLLASLYANYICYQKITFYEIWFESFSERIINIKSNLERIDQTGAFKADDEVGYFFEALKQMMDQLFKMGFFEEQSN